LGAESSVFGAMLADPMNMPRRHEAPNFRCIDADGADVGRIS
jgi:hypothetical protein